MPILFHSELDEAFRSDRSIWIKIGGCAFVGTLAGLKGANNLNAENRSSALVVGITIAIPALIGAVLGLCLSLKDVVKRRLNDGQSVNLVLRAYFGWGIGSLLLWVVTIFFGTIGILLLSLSIRGI